MTTILDKFRLDGKVAVVTGGAGLLGKQFCLTLAQAGAHVLVADLNGKVAEETATSIAAAGYSASPVQVNVTDKDSTQAMADAAVRQFGRLDVLVCSAAMDPKFDPQNQGSHGNRFEDYPLDAWRQAVDVNLTGLFLSSQAVVPVMLDQGQGVIITICSTYGLTGPDQRIYQKPGQPPLFKPAYYSVTKAGVLGFTRYLAAYYAGKNIRVNALTPGGVFNNHDDIFNEAYSARTIMGRMAHLEEMNGGLLFLASDASSYMTGSNLVVDGGWTAW